MDGQSKRKLRTWLQKSLQNHPENENGLVAYVEAIVGDAEGPDEDLREKWTDKLDDFLADSSSEFANRLLQGVRTGSYGLIWRGGGRAGGGNFSDNDTADAEQDDGDNLAANDNQVELQLQDDPQEDAFEETVDADDLDGGGGRAVSEDDDGDDEDEEDDEPRSRRGRRRRREEEEPAQPEALAANAPGSGSGSSDSGNKRARTQHGTDNRNGRGGRGGNGMKGGGRGSNGMGSLAPENIQGRVPGPGQFGGRGPGGMPQGGFGRAGQQGPPGMRNFAGPVPPGPNGPMGPNGPIGPNGPGLGELMGPGGPMRPGGPVAPRGPMGPGGPPIGPGGQMGPRGPMEPRGSMGPIGPIGPGRPMGPIGQGGPIGPRPGMPGGPMQSMQPMQPRNGTGPGIRPQLSGRGGGGLLPTPTNALTGRGQQAGPRGPPLLPGPPSMGTSGMTLGNGKGTLAPPAGNAGPGEPTGPRGPVGHGPPELNGGRGGGRVSPTRAVGPVGERGGPPPMMGGRGGDPGIVGPTQGRPGMGPIPGPQGYGGPGGPVGSDRNGTGPPRPRQSDRRLDMPRGGGTQGPSGVRVGPEVAMFDRPTVRPVLGPGNGPGQSQGMRQGLENMPQQAHDNRPAAETHLGPGMQGPGNHRPGGHGTGINVHGRPGSRQDQVRLERDMREGSDRPGMRPGLNIPQGQVIREDQDRRPGSIDMRSSNNSNHADNHPMDKKKPGRSVFDRLGAPPGQEEVSGGFRDGRNSLDPAVIAQPDRSMGGRSPTNMPQQGPGARHGASGGARQVGPDIRPPGVQQQGSQQCVQDSLSESHGQQGLQRSGGANTGEAPGTRRPPDARHSPEAWPGQGQEGRPGGSGQGRPDQYAPRIGNDFIQGSRGEPGGRGQRQQFRGGDLPVRGQHDGVPQERSPTGRRLQAPPQHPGARDGGGPQGGVGPGSRHPQSETHQQRQQPQQQQQQQHSMNDPSRNPQQASAGQGMGPLPPGQPRSWVPDRPSRPGLDVAPPGRNQGPQQGGLAAQRSGFAGGRGTGGTQRVDGIGPGPGPGGPRAWGGMGVVKPQANRTGGPEGGGGGGPESLGKDIHGHGAGHSQRYGNQDQSQERFQSSHGEGGRPTLREHAGRGQQQAAAHQSRLNSRDDGGIRGRGPGQDEKQQSQGVGTVEGGGGGAIGKEEGLHPTDRVTVRVSMIPSDVGPVELSQHFVEFGKVVDVRMRLVRPEEGGKGEKEALLQFASARQAKACMSSPKAVLGNRFIVVEMSDVNLQPVDHNYVDTSAEGAGAAVAAAAQLAAAQQAAAQVAEEAAEVEVAMQVKAAAAYAARKAAHDQAITRANLTRTMAEQQKILVVLQERVRIASAGIETARAKRDKVQGFLQMMDQKGKSEEEKAPYLKRYQGLSAKVVAMEAAAKTNQVSILARRIAQLEAEAHVVGATVPPPPNAAAVARLAATAAAGGRGGGADALTAGGRGFGRGRGSGEQPKAILSLDNRPTTVKVSRLPASAGEGDLRAHANMIGVVVAVAMTGRPGEGVVKFAERWAAELFITKGKSFAGIPLTMTWHVGPFPGQGGSSTVSGTVQKQTQSRSSPSTLSASSSRSQSPPSAATPASGQAPYPASLKLASANPDDDYGSPGLGREGGGGNGDRDFEGQGWSPEDNDQRKGAAVATTAATAVTTRATTRATTTTTTTTTTISEAEGASGGSSPLQLPTIEGDDDADGLYQDMGTWS